MNTHDFDKALASVRDAAAAVARLQPVNADSGRLLRDAQQSLRDALGELSSARAAEIVREL